MRTAIRVLAVNGAGLTLPTDDGSSASTAVCLDEMLTDSWRANTPEVGDAINQVMQADSKILYQERELEMMVLRSRRSYPTKVAKKDGAQM
jgi:hypothetical protein